MVQQCVFMPGVDTYYTPLVCQVCSRHQSWILKEWKENLTLRTFIYNDLNVLWFQEICLFYLARQTIQFGDDCSWPRYCVLKWVSVKLWSHKRLRGSVVRSVGETVCPSITTPSSSHIYGRRAEFLGILVGKRLFHSGHTKFTLSSKVPVGIQGYCSRTTRHLGTH